MSTCWKLAISLWRLLKTCLLTEARNWSLSWFAVMGPADQPGVIGTAAAGPMFHLSFWVWPLVTFLLSYLEDQQFEKSWCVQARTDLILILKLDSLLEANQKRGESIFCHLDTLSSKLEEFCWKLCLAPQFILNRAWSYRKYYLLREPMGSLESQKQKKYNEN